MELYEKIYTSYDRDDRNDPWSRFMKTRDWYDLPESIEDNGWIYRNMGPDQRDPPRTRPQRITIYPRDIELIYDFSPDDARSFLDDIRQLLNLPVSGPVTYFDLQKYTQLGRKTILDFVMES